MRTIAEIKDNVRLWSAPFEARSFVADWEVRALRISAASDYLSVRERDDAFVDDREEQPIAFDAQTAYRGRSTASLIDVSTADAKFAFPLKPAPADVAILSELYARVDFSEKFPMSAAAHALTRIDMPTALFAEIGNVLYEEGLHLKIVAELSGIDLAKRAWLEPDKDSEWELVSACDDPLTYMLVQHCLTEGRGGLAAAKAIHTAREKGVSEQALFWLTKICRQETRHGILGFLWLHRLLPGADRRLPDRAKEGVKAFVQGQCEAGATGFRAHRQHYSAWLLARYLGGASVDEIVATMKRNVATVLATGEIDAPLDDVLKRSAKLYHLCEAS